MEQIITTMIQVPMFLAFLFFATIVVVMLVAIGTALLVVPIVAVGEGAKPLIRWFSRAKEVEEPQQVPVATPVLARHS